MATANNIDKIAGKLVLLSLAMFGFGYVSVPVYNAFCQATGINGKSDRIAEKVAGMMEVDSSREVVVSFDTNTRGIPWEFSALAHKVTVHPGEIGEATFVVKNGAARKIIGRAVPSVAPTRAAVYFHKITCFCFNEQTLAAGETRKMKARFVVDTNMPAYFSALTLSYTFFEIPRKGKIVQKQKTGKNAII